MSSENGQDKTNRLLEAILLELQDHGTAMREMHTDVCTIKEDIRTLTRRVENLEIVAVDMNRWLESVERWLENVERQLENVERSLLAFTALFKDVQELRERIMRLESKVG
ncbi:MAG: hypothetical protein ACK41G_03515 [Candidatus Thermochlorobacter sp.]